MRTRRAARVAQFGRSPNEYCSACQVVYCLGMMTIDMQRMSREGKLKVMHALWEDLARE